MALAPRVRACDRQGWRTTTRTRRVLREMGVDYEVNDIERAKEALVKAGWRPASDKSCFIGGYPDSMARVGFNVRGGSDFTELVVANKSVPTLLFPSLTEEERKAVEIAIRHMEADMPETVKRLRDLLKRFGGDAK